MPEVPRDVVSRLSLLDPRGGVEDDRGVERKPQREVTGRVGGYRPWWGGWTRVWDGTAVRWDFGKEEEESATFIEGRRRALVS